MRKQISQEERDILIQKAEDNEVVMHIAEAGMGAIVDKMKELTAQDIPIPAPCVYMAMEALVEYFSQMFYKIISETDPERFIMIRNVPRDGAGNEVRGYIKTCAFNILTSSGVFKPDQLIALCESDAESNRPSQMEDVLL
jgi:hypothetical protein